MLWQNKLERLLLKSIFSGTMAPILPSLKLTDMVNHNITHQTRMIEICEAKHSSLFYSNLSGDDFFSVWALL
jgi:hypothetical protein